MRNFRKLEIWHLGMEIVNLTYKLMEKLPKSELFGLGHQMRKAVISMPSNIAEGCSRSSNKDLKRFLEYLIGSAFELETQFMAGQLIGYFSKNEIEFIINKLQIFQRKTNSYRSKLSDA